MNLDDLKKPFPPEDVEWRMQRFGLGTNGPWAMVLAYITNRAIMECLDDVCGPENWRNEYAPAPEGGILCGISIRINTEWVTKWDGAENTNIEAVKGGLSNAMKRAGVQWGIGRYLYGLTDCWAVFSDSGKHKYYHKENKTTYKWNPPTLPVWALPEQAPLEPVVKPKPTDPILQKQKDEMKQLFYDAGHSGAGDWAKYAKKYKITENLTVEEADKIIITITEAKAVLAA